MKLTAGRVHDAIGALVNIGSRPSVAIPMIAKKKLAMMHDQLMPAFELINKKKNALVQQYGEEQFADKEKTKSLGSWAIAPEHKEKFDLEWDEVRKEEVEIPFLKPIPFEMLGNEMRGLELTEFALLGELVTDPKE